MLLLEPRGSAHAARIAQAAALAGLPIHCIDSLEHVPTDAPMVGIGPSCEQPLQAARLLWRSGSRASLVVFTASSAARASLQAELIRDPFLHPHAELLEILDNPHQLATRMVRAAATIEHQTRLANNGQRRGRPRGRTGTLRPPAAAPEPYLAHILAHSSDAILLTNQAGCITAWNPAAERLFETSADQALGHSLDFLAGAQSAADDLPAIAQRVLAAGAAEQAQLFFRSHNGSVRHIEVSVTPVRDVQGKLLGLSLVARDDSEYQRIELALREANRQKDEFVAIMSHELRTPLTSILGYTDMLLRGLSGPLAPLTNKYLGNVRSAGDRLLELVNGLLDYTRLEAGVERLELRPVDLSRLVGQVVHAVHHQAEAKHIDLRLTVGTGVAARVDADEDKLKHALRGMLGNALKFTPEHGWVSVHVGPDPELCDSVRVTVSDSGIGMRREILPRVWERFYQGDASLTRPYGGMGLGLSIARHLVTLHGGTVGAASRGPGLGSTFWLSLPLVHHAG